jgi:hypothetical protein
VLPLLHAGETYSAIVDRVGAETRGQIAGIANRLRTAGKLESGVGTGSRKKSKSVGEPDASFTAPAGRAADKSPAVVSVHSSRKQGGILGGKPSKALREARAGNDAPAATFIPRSAAFDPIPGVEPIGFMQLGPRTCRWPVDGVDGREFLFCGTSCEFEDSYCVSHKALAYAPPTDRQRAGLRSAERIR